MPGTATRDIGISLCAYLGSMSQSSIAFSKIVSDYVLQLDNAHHSPGKLFARMIHAGMTTTCTRRKSVISREESKGLPVASPNVTESSGSKQMLIHFLGPHALGIAHMSRRELQVFKTRFTQSTDRAARVTVTLPRHDRPRERERGIVCLSP